jgi:hypothetical protein
MAMPEVKRHLYIGSSSYPLFFSKVRIDGFKISRKLIKVIKESLFQVKKIGISLHRSYLVFNPSYLKNIPKTEMPARLTQDSDYDQVG